MRTQYDRYPELVDIPLDKRMLIYQNSYRKRNPEKILFRAAKNRALKRNIEFNIDVEDIKIPEFCPILNIKLINHLGEGAHGGKYDSPSIDRIDNEKGYIKGNIQVISNMANSMKFSATKEQLKLFANWINKTYD